jgi:hypothetical protein
VIHEKPLHAQRATVWFGFWAGGVIGPYFFEDGAGNAVTVNGERYRNMITEFLWPQLDGMDLEDTWFVASIGRYGSGRRGSNRMAQPVTLHAKQLICCEKNFLPVSSHVTVTRIGHRGLVI